MHGLRMLDDKNCETCGKLFYPTGTWVYKMKINNEKMKYFCSWTCYRKEQKKLKRGGLKRRYGDY